MVCEYVLHRMLYELRVQFSLTWVVQGVQRHNSRSGPTSRAEGRSIIGFRDGTANLDPRCNPADAALVFCGPNGPSVPPLPSPGPGPNRTANLSRRSSLRISVLHVDLSQPGRPEERTLSSGRRHRLRSLGCGDPRNARGDDRSIQVLRSASVCDRRSDHRARRRQFR